MDYYGIPDSLTEILSICNVVFTIIFAIEMSLKMITFGIPKYFKDKMNYMDSTIVMLSLVELIFMSG